MTPLEEMIEILVKAGWSKEAALYEATEALLDAAEEDGYDGP